MSRLGRRAEKSRDRAPAHPVLAERASETPPSGASLCEARWRAALDCASEAIIARDANDVVTDWNRAAEKLYGYTAQEIVGRPLDVLIRSDDSESFRKVIERIRRGERVDAFMTVRLRKDGKPVYVSLNISPVIDADGRVVGFVSASRETRNEEADQAKMAALTRREQEVLKLLVLGKTNREIGEMLGCTPLTARNHVDHVLKKLNVTDRTQAAVWAVQHGIAG